MTKKNKNRKFRRKGTDKQNAKKGDKQFESLNMKEKFLYGRISDLKTAMGKMAGDINEQVARIDRQTNEFVDQQYGPSVKGLNDAMDKINKKFETMVDIMLDNFDTLGNNLSDKQLQILGLEEDVEKEIVEKESAEEEIVEKNTNGKPQQKKNSGKGPVKAEADKVPIEVEADE